MTPRSACSLLRALLLAGLLALPGIGLAHETVETVRDTLDPDFAAGKSAIEGRNWRGAIDSFGKVAVRDPQNADVQNYLGFANRMSGQLETALKHYQRALQLNPRHRGAHEYIGDAYLQVKNLAKAEEHLAALDRICLLPCTEYSDLKAKITAYKTSKR